ncbi:hypothetical protein KIL84_015510 [Mauremys mutica]|uniref:Uncharacterized protein n=1 Tax=Mauremys mutica TaxID=74926 RepID=A0A9D3WTG0_9SAUR|nr:hypothetical protein KIL84_015510 [Mauremys mutica]
MDNSKHSQGILLDFGGYLKDPNTNEKCDSVKECIPHSCKCLKRIKAPGILYTLWDTDRIATSHTLGLGRMGCNLYHPYGIFLDIGQHSRWDYNPCTESHQTLLNTPRPKDNRCLLKQINKQIAVPAIALKDEKGGDRVGGSQQNPPARGGGCKRACERQSSNNGGRWAGR